MTDDLPKSIAIVEDNTELRVLTQKILQRVLSVQRVTAYESAEEALEKIPRIKPQLVLMDINLPGMNGVECVRQLTQKLPALQIIMLTVYDDDNDIFDSLAAGATGYLLKPVKAAELIEAIKVIHAGGAPMSMPIARRVVQTFKRASPPKVELPELSQREVEVLQLLAQGMLTKEIAEKLEISYWTVVQHVRHIYEKLQVRTRTEAVAKFLGK
jgi:DNA-binding NarL/FixJ family response regulator